MSKERWTEAVGRDVVRRWRRSGASLAAFARDEGCTVQRLRYWRERVESEPGTARLIPGVIVGLGGAARISVAFQHGVVVEAGALTDIAPTWIAAVVRALESAE